MNASYFDNLSGVRGLAAAVVLISHVVQVHFLRFTGLGTPLHQISSLASEYAVVVFFILSGYLIAHTLEVNLERNRKVALGLFAAARIARIYPPLIFSILLSVVVFYMMDLFGLPGRSGPLSMPGDLYAAREVIHLRVLEIVGAMTMLQGMLEINGPLWSIYIEVKLYALFAIALAIFTGRKSLILALAFGLIAWSGIKYNPGFAGYAAVWLTGSLAYYVWNDCDYRRNRLLLCSVLIVTIVAVDFARTLQSERAVWFVARDVFVAMAIAWLLFRMRLRVPLCKRLADCSYSLYATHFPVLLLAQSLLLYSGNSSIAMAVVAAVLSTVAAVSVAMLGGRIEAKKSMVQDWLLMVASRLRRLLVGKL